MKNLICRFFGHIRGVAIGLNGRPWAWECKRCKAIIK